MKFSSIFPIIIIAFSSCPSTIKNDRQDSFEGIVEYAYTYQSDSINIDSLKANRPSSGQMVYKDSMYKSIFIGKTTESYIFDKGFLIKLRKATNAQINKNYEIDK